MSTLHTHSTTLAAIAEGLNVAGYRNAADQISVIARDLLRWDGVMDGIYAAALAETTEAEHRLEGRRLAILTGDVVHLQRGT